ncbi:sucrase ferredoxin [Rhodophyticola sp.]|jgi:hypothetical protein|uniref:sucrase ferredoxin n=1 Tax=Rhodophyticola sp. TaxID=2680032 RepID=UPI003D284507
MPRSFCTDLSRAAGEPLAGTGAHQSRILLLRWPKAGWDRRIFQAPGMSDDLAAAIADLRQDGSGRRVQLIDRKGEATGRHRLFLYPEQLTREVATEELPDVIRALDVGDLSGWQAQVRPVMLACTHGVKDRCCAKYGFALYKALERAADGPEVWESTHLGGCRLSAVALTLPNLHKYGRLSPADAAALTADEAAGRPFLPAWRGPSHLPPEAQAAAVAAEAAARRMGGMVAGDPNGADGAWSAPVRLPGGTTTVHVALEPIKTRRPGTCNDLDAGEVAQAVGWQEQGAALR